MITTRKNSRLVLQQLNLVHRFRQLPSIPVNLNEWEHAVLMDTFTAQAEERPFQVQTYG